MDTDTSWKIENYICRCCHAEGYFFNLSEPRPFCGETEVYADMIRDLFDIDMKPVPGPASALTYTICMSCIFKLREAMQFKKQVQSCEDKFLDYYYTNKLEVVKKKDTMETVVKLEPVVEFKEEYLNEDELDSNDDTNPEFEIDNFDDDGSQSDEDLQFLSKKGKGKGKGKTEPVVPKPETKTVKAEQRTTSKNLVKVERIKLPVKKKGATEEEPKFTRVTKEDGSTTFACNTCQREYKQRTLFTQHYKEVHLKKRRKFRSCLLCDVSVPGHLRPVHLEEAHGIPRPACNACGKKFTFENLLLRHQRTFHMGELNYKCDVCDKRFTTSTKLKRHSFVHIPDKPFPCDFCDKNFKNTVYLQRHMRIHLNDKRYVCNLCGDRFVQTASLKYHMNKRHPEHH